MIHFPLVSHPGAWWEKSKIGFCVPAATFETCSNQTYFLVVNCRHNQHSEIGLSWKCTQQNATNACDAADTYELMVTPRGQSILI
jgi:hypothetical protein